jgi:hypothetical protein
VNSQHQKTIEIRTFRCLEGSKEQAGQRPAGDTLLRKEVKLEIIHVLLTTIALKPQNVNIPGYTNVEGVIVHFSCYNKV